MILHPPFAISSRLLPALRIADCFISLVQIEPGYEGRQRATFFMDFDDHTTYVDKSMQSGVGGFKGKVEIFETFVGFLYACGESYSYHGKEGENATLFPGNIAEWASEHNDELSMLSWELTGHNGTVLNNLIEE